MLPQELADVVIDCRGPDIQIAWGDESEIDNVAYDPDLGLWVYTGSVEMKDVVILNPPAPVNHRPQNLRWAFA
jgi:hypothetical protein